MNEMLRTKIPIRGGMLLLLACISLSIALVGANAANNAGDQNMAYKDPSKPVETRVEDLLKRMTLEEKLGQMTQIERENATADVMQKYFIGSVLSGGGSGPGGANTNATAKQWRDMVDEMQKGALATRLGIPMIYGIDAVHGHNNVYKATIFPHNVGLGVTRDPQLLKRIGEATALEVRATGIPYAFAPCIAVCRDPRWGRCYESYSEDPKIVEDLTSIIDGLQGEAPPNWSHGYPHVAGKKRVAGSAKHFVGDGGTVNGINENNTVIDFEGLLKIHMPGYFPALKKGIATVMASYSSWNGVKMHANHELLTKYLKEKLQFKGFVISDYQGIDKITNPPHANYTYSVEVSINAGIDMVMVPYQYIEFIGTLKDLVNKKVVPMSRIDDAVSRILRVKFAMGLFEDPLSDPSLDNELGSQAHRDLAREAVRKSLVLLKNGKDPKQPVLPLPKKGGKILVAGTHADNLGLQCGGWTISWQGESGNNYTTGTTILKGIEATLEKGTEVVYKENPEKGSLKDGGFSHAIVLVGEVPYAETKGDSLNLTIPHPGPDIISNVCEEVKCVVVLISGRPVVIEPYLQKIDALVAAWLPGSEGQGVADVLFGDFPFTGKLARTWFKRVDQLPMNVGDKNYDPLFPFGFGITTDGSSSSSPSPSSHGEPPKTKEGPKAEKQAEKEERKAQKQEEKAVKQAEKDMRKGQRKEEKAEKHEDKEMRKAERKEEKDARKAEKQEEKEAKKEEKRELKETQEEKAKRKEAKQEEKDKRKQERQDEKKKKQEEKDKRKQERQQEKEKKKEEKDKRKAEKQNQKGKNEEM